MHHQGKHGAQQKDGEAMAVYPSLSQHVATETLHLLSETSVSLGEV
jgi:hypothetical protein